MAIKDRDQNPTVGDTIKLKNFVLNSNNTAELFSIQKVEIYFLDPNEKTEANPHGLRLVETIDGALVTNPDIGEYEVDVVLDDPQYTIGRYFDKWYVTFLSTDHETTTTHFFQIYPQLWYTSPTPIVYDFSFFFQPNKLRFGEKKWIAIEIVPNVPRATDLHKFYESLAISAELLVSISQHCGECVPKEADLRIVVEDAPTTFRQKNRGFYFIDTTTMDCGIYDIWFTLNFGGNTYISPTNQLQIYA